MGSNIENATPTHHLAVQMSLYGLNKYSQNLFQSCGLFQAVLTASRSGVAQYCRAARTVPLKRPIKSGFLPSWIGA